MASWQDAAIWSALRDGTACWTCPDGPRGLVLAETKTTWVTTRREVPCIGYLCVYAKRHVVELYDLSPDELSAFMSDVAEAARVVGDLFGPTKINYEIHGNTNPHLHLHVFPRYVGDPFEGGPIRGNDVHVAHTDDDITRIGARIRSTLGLP